MARATAELPKGSRIADCIGPGVIGKAFPLEKVKEVLGKTGRTSKRQRGLPARVVACTVIALALYPQVSCREVLRCLLEGLAWLTAPGAKIKATGKSGIPRARRRLGVEPVRPFMTSCCILSLWRHRPTAGCAVS